MTLVGHPMDANNALKKIAADLKQNGNAASITVRELLSWFGAQRRGFYVIQNIQEALAQEGLTTNPDFEGAYFDGPIEFELVKQVDKQDAPPEQVHAAAQPASQKPADPTNRIGRLEAANNTPIRVAPNDSIAYAITIMMNKDFSCLPVMTSDRDVKGVVSWTSIGSRYALGKHPVEARECMDNAYIVSAEISLFDAMDDILKHQYALIEGPTGKIDGIVTTYDLGVQFRQLSEPFLLLGEVENHVRRIIRSAKFSTNDLKECCDQNIEGRDVEDVSEMTLGEYIRLLEKPERWAKIGLKLDRAEFVNQLNKVRELRNDVMHFDPDPLEVDRMNELRQFAQFLQRLHIVTG
jgi:CBS domain-containing protein